MQTNQLTKSVYTKLSIEHYNTRNFKTYLKCTIVEVSVKKHVFVTGLNMDGCSCFLTHLILTPRDSHDINNISDIQFRFILESQVVECSMGSFYARRF